MKVFACLVLLAGPAVAQEFVGLPGRVSDDDFYRAVACAAPPGGACRKPFLRWPETRRDALTVSFASFAHGISADGRDPYERALDTALARIDALDAGVRLTRTEAPADIAVHIVGTRPGDVMRGTGVPDLDGLGLPLGRVVLRTRDGEIGHAAIALSAWTAPAEMTSVLLEELVHGLGLVTDVRGPGYTGSLFSEDGNFTTRIEGQDAMALRRHYSPEEKI